MTCFVSSGMKSLTQSVNPARQKTATIPLYWMKIWACVPTTSPIMAKFGIQEWTHSVLFHATFHHDQFTVLYITMQIWLIWALSGAPVPTPFASQARFGFHEYADPPSMLMCQSSSGSVIVSPLGAKSPNLAVFSIFQHSVVAPPSDTETKLSAGAQLQTFP